TVITIPGFLVGWSPLAAMIALGTLAWKRGFGWKLICAGLLAWACRFVIWPIDQFTQESWHEHIDDGMWAAITAGMPIAIGLLITTRQALRTRISELAASRVREQQLHARAVRADERAKIAREMHDVVSYQVTLMAMQAGALQMTGGDEQSREIAGTIRKLCGSTLDELRGLVGALRGPADGDAGSRLADIVELARQNGTELDSDTDLGAVDVPAAVAAAAYRTVQEALTNAHKHAPGAQTSVRIAAEHTKLVVEVRNGPPTRGTPTRAAQLPSGGHGLIGLQERAAMLDGTFDSAPTPDGGFVVTATYPLKPKQARAQTNTPAPAAS
ncbi:MAG: sensor histidine kinase, partial [Sciscionella sp.]|nr:sensor histidine kinase [Sciscionella sp.]